MIQQLITNVIFVPFLPLRDQKKEIDKKTNNKKNKEITGPKTKNQNQKQEKQRNHWTYFV